MYKRYGVLSGNSASSKTGRDKIGPLFLVLLFWLDLGLGGQGISFSLIYVLLFLNMPILLLWALLSDAFCLTFPAHSLVAGLTIGINYIIKRLGMIKQESFRRLLVLIIFCLLGYRLKMVPHLAKELPIAVLIYLMRRI